MQEEKDHNQNTENQEQEEYNFLREVIKKKPVDKKKIVCRAGAVLAGAVLFGAVAAFTFAKALPHFLPEEPPAKVSIPQDTPEPEKSKVRPTKEPTKEPATQSVPEPSQGVEAPPEQEKDIGLEDFRKIYREVLERAEVPERSIVNVQGITSDVDWMNNSFENAKQVSGFLVADNGKEYFVLNEYRAVDQVDRILVTFVNGTTVDAHFQKQDPGTGLAILKIDKEEVDQETRDAVAVAELGTSTAIQRGEPVLAVGSPAGYSEAISYGMVTSLNNTKYTTDNEYHLLTTDIMGDGEGSGVLVSLEGKIVGVIAQRFSIGEKSVVTALPISELKRMIEQLSNNEDLIYLGVRGQNIGSHLAQKTGIPKGIYVNAVEEDSPAMVGGIQNGDVIVKVKDSSVETMKQMRNELDKYKADQKITVTAMRKGAEGYVEIVFDVTVGAL